MKLIRGQTYHFVGIGGIGMSAVARVLHQQGERVQGSDVRESQITEQLRALGVPVFIGHARAHIEAADVIVHSTAVPLNNLERIAARETGKIEAHRSGLLGLCLEGRESVGVTGTHGKGTVAAMVTHALIQAGHDPTFIIGGMLNNYRTNARAGQGPLAVAEIDESDRSHLNLRPHHVVVNNLEVDHLNFYAGLDDIVETMARFINDNDDLQSLALNWQDPGTRALGRKVTKPFVRFGAEGAVEAQALDLAVRHVEDAGDRVRFEVCRLGDPLGKIDLPIPGSYNADNAAAALAVMLEALDLPFDACQQALESFHGLENRFTVRRVGSLTLVKDYISHPTGIRRVLQSARRMSAGRVWGVFKPYRFTLMRYHGEEYAQAFSGADELLITTMYGAEERPIDGISTEWFVGLLRDHGHRVSFVPNDSEIVGFLADRIRPDDMVIFFGGDDFFRMADAWADTLEVLRG